MKEIRKIALGGEIGTEKTSLIKKLLNAAQIPVAGFMTELDRNVKDENGMFPLYIYPAAMPVSERTKTDANLLGACAGREQHKSYTEKFDKLGTEMLAGAPEGSIIVMDELGFLETQAHRFINEVRRVLDSDAYVIMTIKDRFDVPFLNELRELEQISYYRVTEENRDPLAENLCDIVRMWK